MDSDEIKNIISMDDAAIIVVGVATVFQLLNIKVPKILGVAGTAFTVLAMMKTITRITDEQAKLLPENKPQQLQPVQGKSLRDILGN
jgi:hypothetical protein